MKLSPTLDKLVDALKRLPGIGPRSAQRIAFHLLQHERSTAVTLGEALLRLAGNRWAEQTVLDLRKVMKLNRHHSLFKRGRLAESLAEHRELMAAIERRDADGAAALMRKHFAHGLEAAA